MDLQHCADIRGADPASVEACKKVMEDLASLNEKIGDILQTEQVKMIKTGDLLTGRVDSPIAVYMDSLYDLWGSDTVHGDKLAYSKIAIGLLDSLNKSLPESDLRYNLQSRKRRRPGARTAPTGATVSDSAATTATVAAPTGSHAVTSRHSPTGTPTPTSPTGTSPASNPTGIIQPFPRTLVPAANPAAMEGVAAAAWQGRRPIQGHQIACHS
jgi:hypothetical protein